MINSLNVFTRIMAVAAIMAIASIPAFSFGATYAYVNRDGEVRTVTADTAMIALSTAPAIDQHSGVLLLDSPEDNAVVGGSVVKGM
jgi:hypothetical protein